MGHPLARGEPFRGEIIQGLQEVQSSWLMPLGGWTDGRSDIILELEGRGGILEVHGGVGGRGLAGQRSF